MRTLHCETKNNPNNPASGISGCVCVNHLWPVVAGGGGMTVRIITDSNGRKHITSEPLLHQPAPVMTDEKGRPVSFWGGKSVEPIAQPAPVQEPVKWSDYEPDGRRYPAVPDALNPKDENPAYAAGWNDCRAEMLKGMK
jgi:hypothetical protein